MRQDTVKNVIGYEKLMAKKMVLTREEIEAYENPLEKSMLNELKKALMRKEMKLKKAQDRIRTGKAGTPTWG